VGALNAVPRPSQEAWLGEVMSAVCHLQVLGAVAAVAAADPPASAASAALAEVSAVRQETDRPARQRAAPAALGVAQFVRQACEVQEVGCLQPPAPRLPTLPSPPLLHAGLGFRVPKP
jgi:hypothetical protein